MFGTLSYAGPEREPIYQPETAGYDTDDVQCGQPKKSALHRACQRCRSSKVSSALKPLHEHVPDQIHCYFTLATLGKCAESLLVYYALFNC